MDNRVRSCDIVFVLDKSSSIHHNNEKICSKVNNAVDKLKNVCDEIYITVFVFDTLLYTLLMRQPVKEFQKLDYREYKTGGGTALYDCLMESVLIMKDKVQPANSCHKVIFWVMSDFNDKSSCLETDVNLMSKTGLIFGTLSSKEIYEKLIQEQVRDYNWMYKTTTLHTAIYKELDLIRDAVEKTQEYLNVIDKARRTLELMNRYGNGISNCCFYWLDLQGLLYRKYGIEWKSPADLNPDTHFS